MNPDEVAPAVPAPGSSAPVAVYGAYGHTGRFIVAELLRRGLTPVLCGRDAARLDAMAARYPRLARRVAKIDDSSALDRALEGTAAVINAAGPFLDTGAAVLEAALRARVHYLDTSAEQRAAFAVYEAFAARARAAGIVALPSVAFYGALADLLATAALDDWPDADAIDIAVGLDSWHPTRGTRVTGERNRFRRWVVEGGDLRFVPDPPPARRWRFPGPLGTQDTVLLPLSEIVAIARHLRCPEVHAYMNLAPLRDLRDPETPPPVAADAQGRSAQAFVMDVQVRRRGLVRRGVARGTDIYAVTAPLIAEALERVLDGRGPAAGAFPSAQAFDARDFLAALAPKHFQVEFTTAG
ncbi:saccharopine dehydrogenase NADP-binding domain-containing protein [Luteimonas sp. RD2P54]|uniref:Saccharopine dehydrogenase NADP-binding domain-containing protein n=1 Tax=Luteimonas endophytica TaxID=3042023 RepID=A0ABT6JDX4_9GAMM|nr:saccharopine dehydrogenase NADP-binding domain-containing protein [Luteimonas endophytica]MDH5825032.1 saccharopine dehydrogenase NADP-binding domain-containing protein [Luteimonas endophytica]